METELTGIKTWLREKKELVDSFLVTSLGDDILPDPLRQSMMYSLTAGGKRLRPVLALASYEALGGRPENILKNASALEFIHTYSLIHDDLPAMDDDDLRRGKPTNHVVYGEAMAVLAGDGLLTHAFYLLSSPADGVSEGSLLRAVREVSLSAGLNGMVSGQAADMLNEQNPSPSSETLLFIHQRKTAELIRVSVLLGGILYGASEEVLEAFSTYGRSIGLAFQIADDLLDIEGDTEVLGKPAGSDLKKDKLTWPSLYGLERSKQEAQRLIDEAIEAINFIQGSAPLKELATYVIRRVN